MNAPKPRHTITLRSITSGCAAFFLLLLKVSPGAAQDFDHMRVQFGHDAAWTETAPRSDLTAPLPPGPARAGYGYARNAESGAPRDRVRLKSSIFNGM
jgi:hypothetical protein